MLFVLLAATFLRLHDLADIPPGVTHDEADHGVDAWGVVNGIRPLYFTVGYGREPLYDYSTATLMAFLGPTYLAGRITAVFFKIKEHLLDKKGVATCTIIEPLEKTAVWVFSNL